APGYLADLVLVNLDSIDLRPLNHAARQLVFCETGAGVDTVLVGGRVVVQGGRVLTVDEALLKRKAQIAADRLREQNRGEWALADRLAPIVGRVCRALAREPYPLNRYGSADWPDTPVLGRVIRIDDVSHVYSARAREAIAALERLSLHVRGDGVVVLVGPRGRG